MSALSLQIVARCSTTRARACLLTLPHQIVSLPVFMPVGTQGTLKGLTTEQLRELDCQIMLSNTYHLGLRPGGENMLTLGGLHKFMQWDRALLTDSGGFQMVSLLALAQITEEGVNFKSPRDGSAMLLTPEKSIELQNAIGADIIMQLDDVVSSLVTGERVEEAMDRSIRWLDRCIAAHTRPTEQNLFGIVQGGLDFDLRARSVAALVARDLPGYAVGGLSGGEKKEMFWRIVDKCTQLLPEHKPRYLMGVGYAVDMVVCVALGIDMFDCVFPTRTARFGTALVMEGNLAIKSRMYENDFSPIDKDCPCSTCKNYTKAYLHAVATREPTACHLLTVHNIAFQLRLHREMRDAIINDTFPAYVRAFMAKAFPTGAPDWVKDALQAVNVQL